MIVSSTSTNTKLLAEGDPSKGARPARFPRKRDATASSWRTCPNVKDRRNETQRRGRVTGSEGPLHPAVAQQRPYHRCCRRRRPSRPPETRASARPFAPLSVGTVSRSSASSCSPASRANVITGSSPAEDTRFDSSKEADTAASYGKLASARCSSSSARLFCRKSNFP